MELTADQTAELHRLKQYFPYRICFAVVYKETGIFETYAVSTMAKPNRLSREGHFVVVIK